MSGEKRLTANVVVAVDGLPRLFTPEDDIPPDVAEQLGDHVWVDRPDQELELTQPKRGKAQHYAPASDASSSTQLDGDPAGDPAEDPPGVTELPPQKGPGSGVPQWLAYATERGVDVPEGATKDDIIAACRAADVAVEQDN